MNAYEFNKIAGAVLAALLVIVGSKEMLALTGISGSEEGHVAHHATAGFELPAPKSATKAAAAGGHGDAAATTSAAPKGFDPKAVLALIGKGNPDAGKAVFKKCKACHTASKGGGNRVGPNLWNVVGRKRASAPGFKYSAAMSAKGGAWSYGDLAQFIHKPKAFVKGTKMGFGGLKDEAALANLIAYLRTNSDTPVPLPQ